MRKGEANWRSPDFYTESDPFDLDTVLTSHPGYGAVRLAWKDRIEATRVLTARGETVPDIARRLGVSSRSVVRYRRIIQNQERGC